ncbi:MAG: hypothetical protein GXO78_04410 [Calditrichaeota bacterium]|nr:hypothetical protein [Calditrichota bacterium]
MNTKRKTTLCGTRMGYSWMQEKWSHQPLTGCDGWKPSAPWQNDDNRIAHGRVAGISKISGNPNPYLPSNGKAPDGKFVALNRKNS